MGLPLALVDDARAGLLIPASRLEHEPRRARLSTGVAALDARIGGGWPAASLAELCGRRSAGRTSVLYATLAAAIAREQTVALIDTAGAFDPRAAEAAGVTLGHLLWIRLDGHPQRVPGPSRDDSARLGRAESTRNDGHPQRVPGPSRDDSARLGRAESTRNDGHPQRVPGPSRDDSARLGRAESTRSAGLGLQAADILIAAGGFGLVALDFGEQAPRAPTAAWLRLRHAAERQGTTALVVALARSAGATATTAVVLHGARPRFVTAGGPLLEALETRVAVERAVGVFPPPANEQSDTSVPDDLCFSVRPAART